MACAAEDAPIGAQAEPKPALSRPPITVGDEDEGAADATARNGGRSSVREGQRARRSPRMTGGDLRNRTLVKSQRSSGVHTERSMLDLLVEERGRRQSD